MDYKGQQLADKLYMLILTLFGAVSWIVAYVYGNFTYAVQGWFVGLLLALLVCVPDWPFYNRHPVKWLDEIPVREPKAEGAARPTNLRRHRK